MNTKNSKDLAVKSLAGLVVVVLVSMAIFLVVKKEKSLDVNNTNPLENDAVEEVVSDKESTDTSESNKVDPDTPLYDLTKEQKRRADQLTSLFENGTIEILYGYIENLDDGRGYTAGRAGFTTADGDLYMVVQEYTKLKPTNKLAKYLPTLKKLAERGSDSVRDLTDFKKAWIESANEESFIKTQDFVVDKLYYLPSKKYADKLKLKLPISRAFLYDTIIQHGDGGDEDSISALLEKTSDEVGGSPADGIDEVNWLHNLIQVRRDDLKNPFNKDTKEEWSKSTGRCDVFKQILDDKNFNLQGPVEIKTSEYKVTIP